MKLSPPEPSSPAEPSTPVDGPRRKRRETSHMESEPSPPQSSLAEDLNDADDEADDESGEEQSQTLSYYPFKESLTRSPAGGSIAGATSDDNRIIANYVNVAPLPIFRGGGGECPVAHLSRFARVCRANNALSSEAMARIFPVTLDEDAALWYELDVEACPALTWEETKAAFVGTFRRPEHGERLRAELMLVKQREGESVTSFHLRLQWILRKWSEHGMPEAMLKGIFVDGLREDFQDWIVPQEPRTLETAVRLALAWEQAQSIKAAKRGNPATRTGTGPVERETLRCGFCDGGHEEQRCEIRRKMKDLWERNKGKLSPWSGSGQRREEFRSLSLATSIMRRQGEGQEAGASKPKSQCQCWKHRCWKNNSPEQ